MQNETMDVILRRRSVRDFDTRQLDAGDLEMILKAADAAPYAMPGSRHIAVVQSQALLSQINRAAKRTAGDSSLEHLQALGEDEAFHGFYHAPTLVIISGSAQSVAPQLDCAASAQNMLIAAESLHVGACWLYFPVMAFTGGAAGPLRTALSIPDGFEPSVAIAFGYPKEAARAMPRTKTPISFV